MYNVIKIKEREREVKTMERTKEMIQKRIAKLENEIFVLAMKDNWNNDDYDKDRKMNVELRELLTELEAL